MTTLETILEHSKIGIGCLNNFTSPGVRSSVCAPDHVVLDDRLMDVKYMTPEKVTRNPMFRAGLSPRLRSFGKLSKNSMGLEFFGNIGKCFIIPNRLMNGSGQ